MFLTTNGGGLEYPDSISIDDTTMRSVTTIRKHNLQYVEIPLTIKLKTNEIGYITYYGKFGVGTAFLVKARANDVSEDPNITLVVEDRDIRDKINFFRASLIIGAGMEYSLGGNTSFVASIIYNNGFTNVFQKNLKSITIEGETHKVQAKSAYLALNVGVLF